MVHGADSHQSLGALLLSEELWICQPPSALEPQGKVSVGFPQQLPETWESRFVSLPSLSSAITGPFHCIRWNKQESKACQAPIEMGCFTQPCQKWWPRAWTTLQPLLLIPREIFISWLMGLGTFFFMSTQILSSPISSLNISHLGQWVIGKERARTISNKIIWTFSDLLSWNLNSETSGSYMKYWNFVIWKWWVSSLSVFRKCWDCLRFSKLRSVSRNPW